MKMMLTTKGSFSCGTLITLLTMAIMAALLLLLRCDTISAFTRHDVVVGRYVTPRRGRLSSSSRQVATTTTTTTTAINLLNKERSLPETSSSYTSSSSSSALDGMPFLEDPKVPVTFGLIAAGYTIYKYSDYLQKLVEERAAAKNEEEG